MHQTLTCDFQNMHIVKAAFAHKAKFYFKARENNLKITAELKPELKCSSLLVNLEVKQKWIWAKPVVD